MNEESIGVSERVILYFCSKVSLKLPDIELKLKFSKKEKILSLKIASSLAKSCKKQACRALIVKIFTKNYNSDLTCCALAALFSTRTIPFVPTLMRHLCTTPIRILHAIPSIMEKI